MFKWLRWILGNANREKIINENPFDNYIIQNYIQSERVYMEKKELNNGLKPGKK